MLKSLCFLFLVFSGGLAFSQDTPIAKIDTRATFITVDNLDNTYLITAKNELLKYSPNGKLLWNYSNKIYGKPAYVDPSDPMRVLLYFPAQQQVVVLNNNLNEITKYAFRDMSWQVSLIASANTNGYWYYDQANFELHKLSNDFSDVQQSGNLYQLTGKVLHPDAIQANSQNVYLHDPKEGVLQFDRFGGYIKTILTDTLSYFQVKENYLWFASGNSLIKLNMQTYERNFFRLAQLSPIKQVALGNKLFALLTDNKVYLYILSQSIK